MEQANSVHDYLAVGIDASWLLINGLDAGCMRRFADMISLSDWVTKLGLEQSSVRKIGLSGKDFIDLGWDYKSLMQVRPEGQLVDTADACFLAAHTSRLLWSVCLVAHARA